MPPTIATIAQNSVVLNACFVSVVRRANIPTGAAEARCCCAFAATAPPQTETLRGPRVRPRYPCTEAVKRAEATHVRDQTERQRDGNVEPLSAGGGTVTTAKRGPSPKGSRVTPLALLTEPGPRPAEDTDALRRARRGALGERVRLQGQPLACSQSATVRRLRTNR